MESHILSPASLLFFKLILIRYQLPLCVLFNLVHDLKLSYDVTSQMRKESNLELSQHSLQANSVASDRVTSLESSCGWMRSKVLLNFLRKLYEGRSD